MDIQLNLLLMNTSATRRPLFAITATQSRVLRKGLTLREVETITNVAELGEVLRTSVDHETSALLTPELREPARKLANLVLLAELKHMEGLVESGQTGLLDSRIKSEFGFFDQFNALRAILDQTVERPNNSADQTIAQVLPFPSS